MFLETPSSFVKEYIEELNSSLSLIEPNFPLSKAQKAWLGFCLMGILLTNSLCWAKFERYSFGRYSVAALSWMFRLSKIPWDSLLCASTSLILQKYQITSGFLVIDDTDKKRSKTTKNLYHTYKVYDKTTSGFFNGQTVVFALLVTQDLTLPVAFSFYKPAPEYSGWFQQYRKLKDAGVSRKLRPPKPPLNPKFPTKIAVAISLLQKYKQNHPATKVKGVFADNLYGTKDFVDTTAALFQCQVISQIRNNQKVMHRGREMSVESYFKREGVCSSLKVRGGKEVEIKYDCARLFLKSHETKRFLVALKYEGEEEYRYLSASDLSWRGVDILRGFTLRWLVEVFFDYLKQYEGWGQATKQTGIEGSSRGMILSLLLDHCLLLHPQQQVRQKKKAPIATVGSLRERILAEHLLSHLQLLIHKPDKARYFERFTQSVEELFSLRDSSKHMIGRELGRLESTPSLKYRAKKAFTYI
ncbi:MAG: transposase [Simkania sp.]|nr:transposase [Simkania sp.]